MTTKCRSCKHPDLSLVADGATIRKVKDVQMRVEEVMQRSDANLCREHAIRYALSRVGKAATEVSLAFDILENLLKNES